jgi:Xaa-Pro dipeptidase
LEFKLDEKMLASRRWFYYVPASGEPVKIVQSIEQFKLDLLPGQGLVSAGGQELRARLREVLGAAMMNWFRISTLALLR